MIQPFHFHLQKLSAKHLEVTQALLEMLPASPLRENFPLAVRKALHQYLGDVGYYLKGIQETTFGDFLTNLPNPCCVGVLRLEPFPTKGYIEVDPLLSHLIIEKLLGGQGEDMVELKPLTETEQGVIEFLLLKLFSQLHKISADQERFHFRLERMILETGHLRADQGKETPLVCLYIPLSLLQRSGFVKIYLPHPWVLEGFLQSLPKGVPPTKMDEKELQKKLELFGETTVPVWGSVGELNIPYRDFKSLEVGDVVLLDETRLSRRGGKWQGEVLLKVGEGGHGGFVAHWDGFQSQGEVKIVRSL